MVYTIVCQWNSQKEAKAPAKFTVSLKVLREPLGNELDIMTVRVLHALVQYNRGCVIAMINVVTDFKCQNLRLRKVRTSSQMNGALFARCCRGGE